MKKLKILLITSQFPGKVGGGAGVYAFELAKALSKRGIKMHIMAPSKETKREVINNNLIIHWQKTIFKKFMSLLSFFNSIRKNYKELIKKEHINIIHNNGSSNAGFFTLRELPSITTIHHLASNEFKNCGLIQNIINFLEIIMEKEILKKSDKIIAVSHLTKNHLILKNSKLESKINLIEEGVDINLFKPTKNEIRNKYKIKDKDSLIFFPGGARAKRKGSEVLFKALDKLKDDCDFKCIISGESREIGWREEFNELIKKHDLLGNIILVGELDYKDLPKYYSGSDIVVFPSLFEGFGIPILESMACKKPIIASKTGEAPNIINNGKNGFLFNVGDSKDLFNKLKILIKNPKLRKSFGIQGGRLIKLKYSWDKIANLYINFYTQFLKKHNKSLNKK
ncbi:glycosyltransferase family 4 protein [Patescibacteria group bacterium]|nr:glycosyltransferase family 4 protein [Patescibacteria group bacterium]